MTRGQVGPVFCELVFHILLMEKFIVGIESPEPGWQVTARKLVVVGQADADSVQLNRVVN